MLSGRFSLRLFDSKRSSSLSKAQAPFMFVRSATTPTAAAALAKTSNTSCRSRAGSTHEEAMFSATSVSARNSLSIDRFSMATTSHSSGRQSMRKSIRQRKMTVSKEIRALEFAMLAKDYVLILLQVLPTWESECMLRLAWALLDLRAVDQVDEAKKRKVLLSQMNANFLQTGSALEVEGLPPHLMVLGEDNAEQLLLHLLGELSKLPEVLATLETDGFEDSVELVSGETCIFANDFDELADVIKDQELKKRLLRELMTSKVGGNLLVKVRFIAAIDQYEACVDRVERRDLERMIRKIFLTKNSMFFIDSVKPNMRLESARECVLKELCMNEEICAIMDNQLY